MLKVLLATLVKGHTEHVGHNGCLLRAHPNFRILGTWNDWTIIKCPNDCVDLLRNSNVDPLRNSNYLYDPDDDLLEPLPGEGTPIFPESKEKLRRELGKTVRSSLKDLYPGQRILVAIVTSQQRLLLCMLILKQEQIWQLSMPADHRCRRIMIIHQP